MKQVKAFKNGVHPFEGKEYAMDSVIKTIMPSALMVYPMQNGAGMPSKPCVNVGDRVLKGQEIAEAGGFVSARIHSAVSGKVKAIERKITVNGEIIESIVIENDKLDETVEGFGKQHRLDEFSESDIKDIIRHAGIVGLGGACFPTSVKLNPKNADKIDRIIINGAECEPYLTSDYRIMLERGRNVIRGIKAILKVFPNAKAIIGIEDNKPEAIKVMSELALSEYNIDVMPLKTKYPQGGERQLVFAVTGRKLYSKLLPSDKGCVVFNIATCYAIYEAVYCSIPLIHRVMTVTGDGVNNPCNVDVPIGISHKEVLDACGGAKDNVVKFISGGPMMGSAMYSLDTPVQKNSASILAFTTDDVAEVPTSSCIHCGRCVKACPVNLVAQMLAKSVKVNDYEKFAELGGMECIECGCCTYVCPARIPITQLCKFGKSKVRKMSVKK